MSWSPILDLVKLFVIVGAVARNGQRNPSGRVQFWVCVFLTMAGPSRGVRVQIWVCLICVNATYSNAVHMWVCLERTEEI